MSVSYEGLLSGESIEWTALERETDSPWLQKAKEMLQTYQNGTLERPVVLTDDVLHFFILTMAVGIWDQRDTEGYHDSNRLAMEYYFMGKPSKELGKTRGISASSVNRQLQRTIKDVWKRLLVVEQAGNILPKNFKAERVFNLEQLQSSRLKNPRESARKIAHRTIGPYTIPKGSTYSPSDPLRDEEVSL